MTLQDKNFQNNDPLRQKENKKKQTKTKTKKQNKKQKNKNKKKPFSIKTIWDYVLRKIELSGSSKHLKYTISTCLIKGF